MEIREQFKERALSEKRKYLCVGRDGKKIVEEQEVLVEHELDIYINGTWTKKFICSPQYLTELVLGYLCTEGIVERICCHACLSERPVDVHLGCHACLSEHPVDVHPGCRLGNIELVIDEEGKRADVRVEASEKVDAGKPDAAREAEQPMCSPRQIVWKPEWIFAAADRFAEGTPLHEKTWAAHSCFLLREEEILFGCEDIGRHNAFDKVVGYALRNGIDLTKCMIYSSGRIQADMARKAVMVRLPVLAAKAVPTTEALHLAETYGLTLIGAARRDRMKVYTGGNAGCQSRMV